MGQLHITKQGREAFSDNDAFDDLDYTSGSRDYRPPAHPRDWWHTAVLFGGSVGAAALAFALYHLWKLGYCWGDVNYLTCRRLDTAEPLLIGVVTLGTVLLLAWRFIGMSRARIRQAQATANRLNLVTDRYGNLQPADLYDRMAPPALVGFIERQYDAATVMETVTAEHKRLKGINSYSEGNVIYCEAKAPPPALPDTGLDIGPLPLDEWMAWIGRRLHVIVAAETDGGKSTTVKAILAPRIAAGESVFIIDPHFQPGTWFDLPAIGGGRNYREALEGLQMINAEMDCRYREYTSGKKTGDFKRLTVVIDEVPAIFTQYGGTPANPGPWRTFAKTLGSEARKIRISLILITQSPLVQDMGVNSAMQRNFTAIALDMYSIRIMLGAELNKTRKEALTQALGGIEWPATAEINGEVFLLDCTGLDQIPAPPNSAAAAWRAPQTTEILNPAPGAPPPTKRIAAPNPLPLRKDPTWRDRILKALTFRPDMTKIDLARHLGETDEKAYNTLSVELSKMTRAGLLDTHGKPYRYRVKQD